MMFYIKSISLFIVASIFITCANIPSVSAEDKKLVCYFGSWAKYRHGDGKFDVENIDPNLCTHIVYGFAGLDASSFTIRALDPYNDLPDNYGLNAYGRFTGLKKRNPQLKALLAIGGWNEGSVSYSKMVSDKSRRSKFINSVIKMLQEHNFDGLDLDWEYPANRGGVPNDKKNFVLLLQEMREEFDKYGFLMTAAVGVGPSTITSAYDIPALSHYLDFINLMTYDFHGSWDKKTGHNTPLKARPNEPQANYKFNIQDAVNTFINRGASPQKLILGMATYGRTFRLSSQNTGLDAPASGPGDAGPFTRQQGFLGYNEICVKKRTEIWTVYRNQYVAAPWMVRNSQWVAFDDVESIRVKSEWALTKGLGGGMVWSIETDDFKGLCGEGNFPLISQIKKVMDIGDSSGITTPPVVPTTQPGHSTVPPTYQTTTRSPVPITTTSHPFVPSTNSPSASCSTSTYVRDDNNCNIFYLCLETSHNVYQKIRFSCPTGLMFNQHSLVCDWPNNVPECL